MERTSKVSEETIILLSPWWRNATILVLVMGFTVLIWLAVRSYQDAPPIPAKVVDPAGQTLFTRDDIVGGQQVFLKHGLMENGTVWGHGAYLGPDFSAAYLHTLSIEVGEMIALKRFDPVQRKSGAVEQAVIDAETAQLLKANRYDPRTETLTYTAPEADSYRKQ
ncbi:MAG: nitric-oxide reductase large subunit, partial [Desulfuromonadaceae bacterium]|nr:nitric-oxide reductase large subunit [Desulfuromonadaceae bacterium]